MQKAPHCMSGTRQVQYWRVIIILIIRGPQSADLLPPSFNCVSAPCSLNQGEERANGIQKSFRGAGIDRWAVMPGSSAEVSSPDPRRHPKWGVLLFGSSGVITARKSCRRPFLSGSQSPAFSEHEEATAICGLILPV